MALAAGLHDCAVSAALAAADCTASGAVAGMRAALALILLAAPALAETPMTAAEFEARVTGRTMTYSDGQTVWGREQYLPGRRVVWAFEGQDCKRGYWWEEADGAICFAYDDGGAPDCWLLDDRGTTIAAQSMEDPEGTPLSVVEESSEPLICPGPEVGV